VQVTLKSTDVESTDVERGFVDFERA